MPDLVVDLAAWCYARLGSPQFLHSRSPLRSKLQSWASGMLRKRVVPLQVLLALFAAALMGELSDGSLRRGREAAAGCGCNPDSPAWRG